MEEPEESPAQLVARWRAQRLVWERRDARRRRIAWWVLIPYVALGGALGWLISDIARAGLVRDAGVLGICFAGILGLQWIVPYVTERTIAKIRATGEPDTDR